MQGSVSQCLFKHCRNLGPSLVHGIQEALVFCIRPLLSLLCDSVRLPCWWRVHTLAHFSLVRLTCTMREAPSWYWKQTGDTCAGAGRLQAHYNLCAPTGLRQFQSPRPLLPARPSGKARGVPFYGAPATVGTLGWGLTVPVPPSFTASSWSPISSKETAVPLVHPREPASQTPGYTGVQPL